MTAMLVNLAFWLAIGSQEDYISGNNITILLQNLSSVVFLFIIYFFFIHFFNVGCYISSYI